MCFFAPITVDDVDKVITHFFYYVLDFKCVIFMLNLHYLEVRYTIIITNMMNIFKILNYNMTKKVHLRYFIAFKTFRVYTNSYTNDNKMPTQIAVQFHLLLNLNVCNVVLTMFLVTYLR